MHVVRSLSALFLRTCRTFSSPSDVSEFTSCYLRVARRPDLGVALGVLLEAAAFEAVLGVAVRPDLGVLVFDAAGVAAFPLAGVFAPPLGLRLAGVRATFLGLSSSLSLLLLSSSSSDSTPLSPDEDSSFLFLLLAALFLLFFN